MRIGPIGPIGPIAGVSGVGEGSELLAERGQRVRGSADGVEADERSAQNRRRVEADQDGPRCRRVDARRHPCVKRHVAGVEDAPAQHDLHRFAVQVEPGDSGADERDDLVGKRVGRLAGRGVPLGRCVEEDACELEESGVGDGSRVDAGEHGLRVEHPEVGRDALAQDRGSSPAVSGP